MTDPKIISVQTLDPQRFKDTSKNPSKNTAEEDFEKALEASKLRIESVSCPWSFLFGFQNDLGKNKRNSNEEMLISSSLINNKDYTAKKIDSSVDNNTQDKNKGTNNSQTSSQAGPSNNGSSQIKALESIMNKSQALNLGMTLPLSEFIEQLNLKTKSPNIEMIASQLIDGIKLTKSKGLTELVLELKPEWLGNVTLNVKQENGILTVRIFAGEATKQMLDANLAELETALKSSNLNIGSLQVSVGGDSKQGQRDGEESIYLDTLVPLSFAPESNYKEEYAWLTQYCQYR